MNKETYITEKRKVVFEAISKAYFQNLGNCGKLPLNMSGVCKEHIRDLANLWDQVCTEIPEE